MKTLDYLQIASFNLIEYELKWVGRVATSFILILQEQNIS